MGTQVSRRLQQRQAVRLIPAQFALAIAVVALIAGSLAFVSAPRRHEPASAPRPPAAGPAAKPVGPAPAAVTDATKAAEPQRVAGPKPADPWSGWAEQDLAYWKKLEIGGRMGRITIPKAGADIDVVKGAGDEQLIGDAGFVMGSSYPGPNGNAAIGAHRTTYKHPFRRIDVLKPGDEIVFRSPFREYHYVVTGHTVVKPTDIQVLRFSRSPIITLVACHPPGSEQLRYIVRGKLTSVTRLKRG